MNRKGSNTEMIPVDTQITILDRMVSAFPNDVTYLSAAPLELRIDDRDSDDSCYSFCEVTLKVDDLESDQFQLVLHNVPWDEQVKEAASELSPSWATFRSGTRLIVTVSTAQVSKLLRLAKAIRQVVGRGKSYPDRNWKWIAPRTAKSLEQLARAISKAT